MNEWGVAIAESSTSARIVAPSDKGSYNSRPLFPIEELSRVALERCNSSRCAVTLMGQLADTYGFYPVLRGDSDAALKTVPNEGGESLLVGDANEAWVFHVLSDGGEGAVWCSQRVEDNEFVVVANMMVIREVDLSDVEVDLCIERLPLVSGDCVVTFVQGVKFLFSSSMTKIAQAKGWWQPATPFDFTKIFSYGEYFTEG
jgi:dipeptidase